MKSPFTRRTLSFLRAMKRNNDREWFRERRDQYEAHVRGPMVALIDQLATDFASFAPEFVAEPKVSLLRVYRDTRFSADKRPLKTTVAAMFPVRGRSRGDGAGLYLEVGPTEAWIGGGKWMPSSDELRLVRAHVAATYPRIRRIATAPAFTKVFGTLDGEQLTRLPRGYAADDPAAHYLRFKQFVAGREFPSAVATEARFHREILTTFRALVPLVRFLNEAIEVDPAAAPPAVPRPAKTTVPEPMW